MSCRTPLIALLSLVAVLSVGTRAGWPAPRDLTQAAHASAPSESAPIDVIVHEGTSMSVAVSPDGHTLAIDLQGSLWILPAAGGFATRITDLFTDARQPVWSPDGKWITFFSYRDGSYDIWAIEPDGSHLHQLTWGPFDDREPAWSHDGTQLAFASDRGDPLGSHYHIWVLDMRSAQVRQLTEAVSEDSMPTWSPDDQEIAFASMRENEQSVWAVNVADGTARKVVSASGRVDAPSWGPGGQIVYHVTASGQSRFEADGKAHSTRFSGGVWKNAVCPVAHMCGVGRAVGPYPTICCTKLEKTTEDQTSSRSAGVGLVPSIVHSRFDKIDRYWMLVGPRCSST